MRFLTGLRDWYHHLHDPVCNVAKRNRKHIKLTMIHLGVLMMGADAAFAWALIPLAEHIAHICAGTGATIAGAACYLD